MGLINLGAGLAEMGQGIANFAGQMGLEAQREQLEEQKIRLASQLSGGEYDVAMKRNQAELSDLSTRAFMGQVGAGGPRSPMAGGGDQPQPSVGADDDDAVASGGESAGPAQPSQAPEQIAQNGTPSGGAVDTGGGSGVPPAVPVGMKGEPVGGMLPPGVTPRMALIMGPEGLAKEWEKWSGPQNLRPNAMETYYDPVSGKARVLAQNPDAPPGYRYDPDTDSFVSVGNGPNAVQAAAYAKSSGESQGALPAELSKIGATGAQERQTAAYKQGLENASTLVPHYDPDTGRTTMVTVADALAIAGGQGQAPQTVIDHGALPKGAGVLKDGSYKTSVGTVIPSPPKLGGAPEGGFQEAPSAADAATQANYANTIKGWESDVQPMLMTQQGLFMMASALKQLKSGAWTNFRAGFARQIAPIVGNDMATYFAGADPAQAQILLKNNINAALGRLASAHLGRITEKEIGMMQTSLANPNLQPEANFAILSQGVGVARYQVALANDWNVARRMGYSDPYVYEQAWSAANPLQGFVDKAAKDIGPLAGMKGFGGADNGAAAMPALNARRAGVTTWTNPNGVTLVWTKGGWKPRQQQ